MTLTLGAQGQGAKLRVLDSAEITRRVNFVPIRRDFCRGNTNRVTSLGKCIDYTQTIRILYLNFDSFSPVCSHVNSALDGKRALLTTALWRETTAITKAASSIFDVETRSRGTRPSGSCEGLAPWM